MYFRKIDFFRDDYVGGDKPGKRGWGALGKALMAVAVEDI